VFQRCTFGWWNQTGLKVLSVQLQLMTTITIIIWQVKRSQRWPRRAHQDGKSQFCCCKIILMRNGRFLGQCRGTHLAFSNIHAYTNIIKSSLSFPTLAFFFWIIWKTFAHSGFILLPRQRWLLNWPRVVTYFPFFFWTYLYYECACGCNMQVFIFGRNNCSHNGRPLINELLLLL